MKRISTEQRKQVLTELFHSTDGLLMVMAAHRYCLGRQSYIVSACIEYLDMYWDLFAEETQSVIIRDTKEAIERDEAGAYFDKKAWAGFVDRHTNGDEK